MIQESVKVVRSLLESLMCSKQEIEAFLDELSAGESYDDEVGIGVFHDGSESGICTNGAKLVADKFGGKVFGYSMWDRKRNAEYEGKVAYDAGGHDFALIHDRYLVDWWGCNVESSSKAVYDLQDPADAEEVSRLYLPRKLWVELQTELAESTLVEWTDHTEGHLEEMGYTLVEKVKIGDITMALWKHGPHFYQISLSQDGKDFTDIESQQIRTPAPYKGGRREFLAKVKEWASTYHPVMVGSFNKEKIQTYYSMMKRAGLAKGPITGNVCYFFPISEGEPDPLWSGR